MGLRTGVLGVAAAALGIAAIAFGAGSAPQAAASIQAVTFQAGVTHTQSGGPDPWGDPGAISSAKSLLRQVGPLQNQHLMGWGTDNPEPSPGVYDWTSLDGRISLIRETGGVPVITLCTAPGWMKGTDDWDMNAAPTPDHYDDFADLALETAKRYPDVKYFQVWNEFKGFWDDSANRWNYEGYTELYNLVYAKLKAYNPDIQVGGPYVSVNIYKDRGNMSHPSSLTGTWGTVDQRDLDAIEYWLAHKTGADFLNLDTWASTRDGYYPPASQAGAPFQAITQWLTARTTLPVWWAEFYAPLQAGSDASSPAAIRAVLTGMRSGGASVGLLWAPECDGSDYPCLWSSTAVSGGGQPTDYFPVIRDFSVR